MTEIVPKDALAAYTRLQIADHDEWDSFHEFMTLHNVDGEIKVGTYAMIDPAMPPASYPALISKMALERKDGDLPAPCAYLLKIEAHMMIARDRAQMDEIQRDSRRFSERPDSIEIANAICADVHGRVYAATKRRDNGEVSEQFAAPMDRGNGLRGRFTDALLACAYATGVTRWGLPGPPQMSN